MHNIFIDLLPQNILSKVLVVPVCLIKREVEKTWKHNVGPRQQKKKGIHYDALRLSETTVVKNGVEYLYLATQ